MLVVRQSQVLVFSCLAIALCGSTVRAQQSAVKTIRAKQSTVAPVNNDLIAEGFAALERADFETARRLLERALTANPKSVEAHTYLGVLEDRSNNFEIAKKHFANAARLSPKSASVRNNYGAILLRLNDKRLAAAEFEASLKLDPNQANALINLAQIRFDENTATSLPLAQSLFHRADRIAPDAQIAKALTVIALRLKNNQQAAEFYKNYAARLADTNENADAAARAEFGGALLESNLLGEAQTELKAALALDAANVDAIVNLAKVYLALKDVPAAGRTLETAVAKNIANAAVYSTLAVVYERINRFDNAIPAMRLAIQLEPAEKYYFQYGMLLANTDAPAAAVIRINEALKKFPDSARLWFALGFAELKAAKNVEAAEAFNRAVQLDPKYVQGYVYLGLVRDQLGQIQEAVQLYERALQINPKLGVVNEMIAGALLKESNADNARIETELKKAIAQDVKFVPAHLTLGKLYIRTERWADAAAELQRVIELEPDSVEAHYQIARVYVRLKRKEDAQTALAKFKALNESQKEKSNSELREIVRRLQTVYF